jgi:hypothetical protein
VEVQQAVAVQELEGRRRKRSVAVVAATGELERAGGLVPGQRSMIGGRGRDDDVAW